MGGFMDIVLLAVEFAAKAHDGQKRKGNGEPYIGHPYSVGMILALHGCDDAVIAAGILHDTLEDTAATADELRRVFGERVTALVEGASEPDKSLPWEERKRRTIEFLKTAPLDVRLVSAADKLHNLLSLERDLADIGDAVWDRFRRRKADQEWYYRSAAESIAGGREKESPLFGELLEAVERVFGKGKPCENEAKSRPL
jgi:(p)ppGpp synthase/HD superfamily hydrolase